MDRRMIRYAEVQRLIEFVFFELTFSDKMSENQSDMGVLELSHQ